MDVALLELDGLAVRRAHIVSQEFQRAAATALDRTRGRLLKNAIFEVRPRGSVALHAAIASRDNEALVWRDFYHMST